MPEESRKRPNADVDSFAALDAVFRHAPVSIAAFSHDMRYVCASARWIAEHGLPSVDAVLGERHYDFFPDLPEHWLDGHRRCLAGERVTSDADRIELPDGGHCWLRWEMAPWRPSDGAPFGMIIRKDDVTHEIEARLESDRLTRDLVAAKEEAQSSERLFRSVIDFLPYGFTLFDAEDRLVIANEVEHEQLGAAGGALRTGATYEEIVREQLRLDLWEIGDYSPEDWVGRRIAGRATMTQRETMLAFKDGRWMRRNERRLPGGQIVGLSVDLTEHMKREAALEIAEAEAAAARQRLIDALEGMSESFVVFDAEDRLVLCNEQYKRAYAGISDIIEPGVPFETLLRVAISRGVYPLALGREEEWLEERLARRRNPSGPFEQHLEGGRCLRVEERRTRNGDIVGIRTDITELKRQQEQLSRYAEELVRAKQLAEQKNLELQRANKRIAHSALHDPLTGLGNRRFLDERIAEAKQLDEGVAVLHLDLDRFKQINDTLGHDAGDKVLIHVAAVLRETVGPDDAVARIGGDEFVALRRYDGDISSLKALAARLIEALSKPVVYDGQPCRIGASVGVAIGEAGGFDEKQLLIDADLALYRAKNEGRNRYEFFTDQLQAEIIRTKQTADDILRGLENDEFIAHYQPQFCARTGRMLGMEALARWRHPTRGLLPPAAFLAVAESLCVVGQIDRAIMRNAGADFLALRAKGLEIGKVSVNVSARRLRDPSLIEDVAALGLPCGAMSVELLEAIFLDEADEAISWSIDRLQELGVDIELDDFGSGRTSIISLVRLEPRRLKIDQQLIFPLTRSSTAVEVARAVLDIGRSLGVEVIAEGVETMEHADILKGLGCDALQGYALARPRPIEGVERLLRDGASQAARA